MSAIMLAPIPNRTYVATNSGTPYSADAFGIIPNVATPQDVTDLKGAGCIVLQPTPSNLIAYLKQADFNHAGFDQAFTFTFLNAKYRVTKITAENGSPAGMSTAVGGIFTAVSGGGTAIVGAGQTYTGLTNAATALDLTLAAPNLVNAAGTPLYLRLATPQGATASADLYVWGDVYTP